MDKEVGSKRYAAVSLTTAFSNLLNMSHVLLNFMCDQLPDSLIHLLPSWSRVHLEKLTVAQLLKNFSKCYRIEGFVAVFMIVHRFSLF
jgi:hypothetical protein